MRPERQGHGKFIFYLKKNRKPVRALEQGLTGSNFFLNDYFGYSVEGQLGAGKVEAGSPVRRAGHNSY